MADRIQYTPGWENLIQAAADHLLENNLGPKITADARRYCPVDKGDLRDSIAQHMEDHTLVISATGSKERTYAAWVELGHRVAHGRHGRVGPEVVPPEPFLRPALMQPR